MQNVLVRYHLSVECTVSFLDPVTRMKSNFAIGEKLCIGREPGENGLVVGGSDRYVSSIAVELATKENELIIWNRSSHSALDIRTHNGLRVLFPNEKFSVRESATIIIPSSDYRYKIDVEVIGALQVLESATNTQQLDGHDLALAVERIPTLCGLCASYFYPEKYGSAPLTANQIAEKLTKSSHSVTAKAVNNKIQRTREQVEAATGLYLDDREGLAQYLIRTSHITKAMVDEFF